MRRPVAVVLLVLAFAALPRRSPTAAAAPQAGPQNVSHLVWYDRAGKRLSVVDAPANERAVELSPDGTRAAISLLGTSRLTRDIWIVDLASGTRTRFTDDDGDKLFAVWSPDGRQIVFDRDQQTGGARNLYEKPADGSRPDTLLFGDQRPKWPLSFSPDGRWLAFVTFNPRTGQDIEVLPLGENRRQPIPFQQTTGIESYPRFSPDGRWIAFGSDNELFVAPFPGPGPAVQVSSAPATLPRWRRDGKELFFIASSGSTMTLTAAPISVEGSRLQIGTPVPLFEIDALATGFYPYDVSADGQRILVDTAVTQPTLAPKATALGRPAGLPAVAAGEGGTSVAPMVHPGVDADVAGDVVRR
jgi:Tol biopolymer transport system component